MWSCRVGMGTSGSGSGSGGVGVLVCCVCLVLVLVLVCAPLPVRVSSLANGLAVTPPLGWNSWNHFGCDIDEQIIKQTADTLVSSGLRDVGYVYVNLDDCWQNMNRSADGSVYPDPIRFPAGFAALAEYIHARGLKFGVYSDSGSATCMNRPGSRGFESKDAHTYASWGVDYLKYDDCNAQPSDWIVDRYSAMSSALLAAGRPILYSLCEAGIRDPWNWAPPMGNCWRTALDIADSWESMLRVVTDSVGLARYAGPGGWNDFDMLEVGNGGMSIVEYKTHFAVWCIVKSPLLIGADIRTMSSDTLAILTSKELIAVNQDPLGVAGDVVYHVGPHMYYACPLADGGRAVALLNLHLIYTQYPMHNLTIHFTTLGYAQTTRCLVRDLYLGSDLGVFQGSFTGAVIAHGVLALRITPIVPQAHHTKWRPWHAQQHQHVAEMDRDGTAYLHVIPHPQPQPHDSKHMAQW